eukprot:GAFH01001160.1.p2 GENE.GAFH01001160.1~~GAFH01001160.1.p2  ORF type:complete len:610 (-),score=236.24 GAFH01001160.1:56-1861(-)
MDSPGLLAFKKTADRQILIHIDPKMKIPDAPSEIEVSSGTPHTRFAEFFPHREKIAAYKVNNLVVSSLSGIVADHATISPVYLDYSESIYRRSLVFLFIVAVRHQFPGTQVSLLCRISNAYLMNLQGGRWSNSPADIAALTAEMRALVARKAPFDELCMGYDDALRYFGTATPCACAVPTHPSSVGQPLTAALLQTTNDPEIPCSGCEGVFDLYHRPLVEHAGMLDRFDIVYRSEEPAGLLLHFPSTSDGAIPATATISESDLVLARVHNENMKLGLATCMGQVNKLIRENKAKDFVATCNAVHEQRIAEIVLAVKAKNAALIAAAKGNPAAGLKMILIGGPSSSGKTTFARRLMIQLRLTGFDPLCISVDDYYKPREECRTGPGGSYDFECLEALRIPLFNQHMLSLFAGQETETPKFDFHTGLPSVPGKGRTMRMSANSLLIVEGIHCLNPAFTSQLPANALYRIFIAPLTQMKLDDHNFISNQTTRALRRIVRDYFHRGWTATNTLRFWPDVLAAENRYIFPFTDNADFVFNSSLDYEFAVLKVYVEPLLKCVKPSEPEYNLARELLNFLWGVLTLPHDWVPATSLLREFIGGNFYDV